VSLLALNGCVSVSEQLQGSNPTTVSNPTTPAAEQPQNNLSAVAIPDQSFNLNNEAIPFTETSSTLNYAAFLELLEASDFTFDEGGNYSTGLLFGHTKFFNIRIGDERLIIYEYESNEKMERISNGISKSGTSISFDNEPSHVQITWAYPVYFFRKDIIVVFYQGENELIINFLMENLEFIAGRHYPAMDMPHCITIRGEQFRTDLTELNLDNVPVDGHFIIGNALRNEDIVPLRYMTNLTTLSLRGSHISDLTPLSGLTNLTYLNLNSNQVSDITPLYALTSLEHLDIRLNMISDLTPLTGLTNLTLLTLYGNHINDVSPLSGLTNLTHLGLWMNEISDISPLAELTNLTRLNLSGNRIQNLTPLSDLTNLTELWLGDNRILDISALSGLINLTELRLYRNQIADWSPVAHVDYVVGRPE
jgi:Leucine-rich repeat (LRR) protein